MQTRTIGLIVMCAALAACNSKSPEPAETPTENASQAAEVSEAPAVPATAIKPAPDGLPSRVAREVITAGNHKCDGVTKAERNAQDGSIVASCTGGESYRVYTVEGQGAVATKL